MKLAETISEFDLALATGAYSKATRQLYAHTTTRLLAHLGPDIQITDVTLSQLRRWQVDLNESDLSVYTVHRHIRQTRRFFSWCVEGKYLEESPAQRLALPRLPRDEPPKAIDTHDMERMLDAARRRQNPRDYAILRFLIETGCRLGGLLSLKPEDLDLRNCRTLVREKGRRTRSVPFGEITADILRAALVERPLYLKGGSKRYNNCTRADDALFLGQRGNLTKSGVYRILRRLAVAGGVEGRFNPHAFRHGLARRLLNNSSDLGTVSKLLGHSSIDVTHRFYTAWTKDELFDRHREYGGILET